MEEKKLNDEELKQAFFILRHGSSEGLSEYIKAVLAIESEYARQKAEIERLTEEKQSLIGRKAGLDYSYNQVKEKNAELQKQVYELKEQFLSTCENCHLKKDIELLRYQKEQAVKDTAKEIYDYAKDFFEWDEEGFVASLKYALEERYGVEVE